MGMTLVFFHSDGNSLFAIHDLNMISKGWHIEILQIILSGVWGLLDLSFKLFPKM